nr:hypothetical protein [Bacteroides intestinalis]
MKLNVSNEFKIRLSNAAANGSVIAEDILAELKKNPDVREIIRGSYNYFSTKRKRTRHENFSKIRIVFTACSKDLTHPNFPDRNNPQAPWFPENRADIEPSTLVNIFKNLRDYTSKELEYFGSALCTESKVTVKIYSRMQDFMDAYLFENYSPVTDTDESTLHNSCMRYEDRARNAADFYTNFAGAKILIAKDEGGNILGRAIVWDKAKWKKEDGSEQGISLLDRIYTSHTFVLDLLREQARSLGINFRKRYNDFSHPTDCIVLNPPEDTELITDAALCAQLKVEVPASKWHKKGTPYLDTFYSVFLVNGKLELCNYENSNRIASCRGVGGYADKIRKVCPGCGKIHNTSETVFCNECYSGLYTSTIFGTVLKGSAVQYKGKTYPSVLFKKGRPIAPFRQYLQIEKLYTA